MKRKQRKSLLWRRFGYLILIIINSLIIYEEKTKKITAVKEVSRSDPNISKQLMNLYTEFFQELLMVWQATSNTWELVLSDIQTPRSRLKQSICQCLDVCETHFFVFDILLQTQETSSQIFITCPGKKHL